MTYSPRSRRLAGLFVLLPVALAAQACAPAAHSPASDPSSARSSSAPTTTTAASASHQDADACPAIEPLLHRDVTLMLEAGDRMTAGGSKSLAATMSGIYTLEQTFKRSSAEVGGFKFADPENAKDAAASAKEIEAARAMFTDLRTKFEDLVRKTGTPLRQAREKAWEMRTVCEGSKKPNGDCRSIMKVFSDAELSTWMGSVDSFRDAITKIDKMKVKDSGVANDLATVRSKLTAASEAASEMINGFDTTDVKDEVKKHTKLGYDGLSRISKRCGENTKLAPVDWVAAPSGTDPRKLTVLVVGVLPEPMRKIFDERGETKGDLTSGSTGSGVLVVRKSGGNEKKVYVVTNRHVVDHALRTKILIDGSTKYIDANVAYVDSHHDLAILEVMPGADGTIPVDAGVTLETTPAADQQTVVAAGFPGMGDRPSYQVTRGYISNRKLTLGDGEITPYIQHTAPTDSGSSGGPLLSEGGRLLGINTLKMRGREGVSISIPARLVVEAFRSIGNEQAASSKDEARVACLKTIADVSALRPPASAARRLSATFVADVGPPAYQRELKRMSKDEAALQSAFYSRDPLGTLNWISLKRLQESVWASGGVSDLELCEGVTMTAANASTPTNARFLLQTMKGPRELKLIRERGDWAVASFDFRDNGPVAPAGKGKAFAGKAAGSGGAIPVADAPKRAKERKAVQAK